MATQSRYSIFVLVFARGTWHKQEHNRNVSPDMTLTAAVFTFTFVFCSLMLLVIGFKQTWQDVCDWQASKRGAPQKTAPHHACIQWNKAAFSKH
jgi:hypothetical protein